MDIDKSKERSHHFPYTYEEHQHQRNSKYGINHTNYFSPIRGRCNIPIACIDLNIIFLNFFQILTDCGNNSHTEENAVVDIPLGKVPSLSYSTAVLSRLVIYP